VLLVAYALAGDGKKIDITIYPDAGHSFESENN